MEIKSLYSLNIQSYMNELLVNKFVKKLDNRQLTFQAHLNRV